MHQALASARQLTCKRQFLDLRLLECAAACQQLQPMPNVDHLLCRSA
jgi:hypothetical protein